MLGFEVEGFVFRGEESYAHRSSDGASASTIPLHGAGAFKGLGFRIQGVGMSVW